MVARAQKLAQKLAKERAEVLAWVRAQEPRWGSSWVPQALDEALDEARTLHGSRKSESVARAERVVARAGALSEALLGMASFAGRASHVTSNEVMADSELLDAINLAKNRHHLSSWHLSEHWSIIQIIAPITRLPQELLYQILLILIDNVSDSHFILMRVSKLWYNIVTGIWASLKMGTTTSRYDVTKKLERNQWLLDVVVDTEIDRSHFTSYEGAYQGIFAAIKATPRWRSFIVESFPVQADLPEHLVNTGLQQCSDAVMSRLRTFKIKCTCEMSPLLERLLCILGTTASEELTTIEIKSPSVISFLIPTYTSIFRSVTVLSLDNPGVRDPVDLLPHLHQLEKLTASHLSLPVYPDDANLPLVHTLRHLSLRAVSIQWMSGRTFHALESCTLLFPLHRHVLHTFSTNLPKCDDLTFRGYPLDILHGVSAHNLTRLSVMCFCSKKSEASLQLVRFSSHALRENRLPPRILHISIEAMNKTWMKAFTFMSNLEELVIDNAQPSSLGVKALQALVVHSVHSNNLRNTDTHEGQYTPLCPSLKRFGLRYCRWFRSSEHLDLIPELVAIILSRQQSTFSLQSFHIWKESDQKEPLELIEGSRISLKTLERLTNDGAITGADLVHLVARRLAEKMSNS